ncbi:hypothetical protein [Flavobacterium hydrophilum]|uniref:Uncharacterized protein n=1 Tax=Flavobacterium hydrophilum TaxID=2211445 RepID=A0A2V4BX42_9FLAO|nr:hypothetical protein [Flavobacterium hydrophilum]PXY43588.1 hypothetical protein DMB68_18550 [Flavobacterium hydrophilum]
MKYFLFIIFLAVTYSCCPRYNNYLSIKPTNTSLKQGKWLIDEPLLERFYLNTESVVSEIYKNKLTSKYDNIKYLSDLNEVPSFNKALDKSVKALDFYKSKTGFNYLISTKLEITNSNFSDKKILTIRLIVYNLDTKCIILDKDYYSAKRINNFNSNMFKEFVEKSMKKVIKDFTKNDNWKAIEAV